MKFPIKLPLTALSVSAVEALIEASVVGLYDLKGDYTASTNTPDLDTSPIAGIEKGDVYRVADTGLFFTEVVEGGDQLVALQDAPTLLTHWSVTQNNLTEATETIPGYVTRATSVETIAGADGTKYVAPATLKDKLATGSFHDGCRASFIGNVNIASCPSSVNGLDAVTFFVSGETRLLAVDQTDLTENGPWIYNGVGSALTRPLDYANGQVLKNGFVCEVMSGDNRSDALWHMNTSAATLTVGTDGVRFHQMAAASMLSSNAGTSQPIIHVAIDEKSATDTRITNDEYSRQRPWSSITAAIAFASSGTIIEVWGGDYTGEGTIATKAGITLIIHGGVLADTSLLTIVDQPFISGSPGGHAATHVTGGGDAIQLATNAQPGLASAAHITAIEANDAKVTNATHSGDATGATVLTIAADAVTYAKMQNVVADQVVLGNIAGAGGIVAELTPAQLKTMTGYLTDLVDDTTPQLGGNLDTNGMSLANSGSGVTFADDILVSAGNTHSIGSATAELADVFTALISASNSFPNVTLRPKSAGNSVIMQSQVSSNKGMFFEINTADMRIVPKAHILDIYYQDKDTNPIFDYGSNILNLTAGAVNITNELTCSSDVVVGGNLTVEGTTTTVDSETVLLADNHMYINAGYTTAVAQTGGFFVNNLPTATVDTVSGSFVAGVAAVSNPTVGTTGAATFSASDFVQFSDDINNGVWEVLTHAANVLTVRGIGTTGTVEDWTQNQFVAGTGLGGDITKVTIGAFRMGTDGIPEHASGSTSGLTFVDLNGADIALNNTHRTSDGSDHTFIDQSVIAGASPTFNGVNISGIVAGDVDQTHIICRKNSAGTITKGRPVYIVGYNVGGWHLVEEANNSSAATMPAIGVAEVDITNAASSFAATGGHTTAQDTSSHSSGDELYVGAGTALTSTKPTGTAFIQKMAQVGRSHATLGTMDVTGAGRTNDVPNIPSTQFWLGNGSGVATAVSMSGDASMTNAGVVTVTAATGAFTVGSSLDVTGISRLQEIDVQDQNGDFTYSKATWAGKTVNCTKSGSNTSITINTIGADEVFHAISNGTDLIEINASSTATRTLLGHASPYESITVIGTGVNTCTVIGN